MRRQGRLRRVLGRALLALGLAGGPGCLSFVHPIDHGCPELVEACRVQPKCARDHVHVFFVHGMDPFDCANLEGVRDYVNALGFHKTYYGQLYHTWQFEKALCEVHRADPEARFVLVGFSFGANMARNIAQEAKKDGILIDLLVYLGGNTLKDTPGDQPENVCRILNVLAASGCIWNGDTMRRAENIEVPGVWHFGSPSHPCTLRALARELAEVAARVPVAAPAAPAPAWPEAAPTPRPVTSQKPAPRDEWDFLKPASHLGAPASARR